MLLITPFIYSKKKDVRIVKLLEVTYTRKPKRYVSVMCTYAIQVCQTNVIDVSNWVMGLVRLITCENRAVKLQYPLLEHMNRELFLQRFPFIL